MGRKTLDPDKDSRVAEKRKFLGNSAIFFDRRKLPCLTGKIKNG